MSTVHPLVTRYKRKTKKRRSIVTALMKCSHKKGVIPNVFIKTPKKQNSSKRKVARVKFWNQQSSNVLEMSSVRHISSADSGIFFIFQFVSFFIIAVFLSLYVLPIQLKAEVSLLLDCMKDCRYVVFQLKELLAMPYPRPANWEDQLAYFYKLLDSLLKELESEALISELNKLPVDDIIREHYNVTRDQCLMYSFKVKQALTEISK